MLGRSHFRSALAKGSRRAASAGRSLHLDAMPAEDSDPEHPTIQQVNHPTDMAIIPKPPPPHVVIVGGGLAGLAVASCLVNRGLRLTLLESRPRLGGRASSFQDPVTGELVDNCQHVSMACCTNLADFCRRVGIDTMFRRERELVFLDRERQRLAIPSGPLPAPFHLAGSFLRARFLSVREKVRLAYGLARLACSSR